MKAIRRFIILAISAIVLTSALAFVGCGEKDASQTAYLTGSMKLVIAPDADATATVIDVDLTNFTEKDKVFDVVDALTDQGKLCYKGTKGIYGVYLTAIGVPQVEGDYTYDSYILEEDSQSGKYLYIYTNVAADMDDGEYATTVTYEEKTLSSSLNGISKMSIEDGAIIYMTYIIWG